MKVHPVAPAAVGDLPPHEFRGLAFLHILQLGLGDVQAPHDRLVDHDGAARGDRTHRQLGPLRNSELADEEDVQWRAERRGHLPADRHAATGKPEHHDVSATAVGRQLARQDTARLAAVPEGPVERCASYAVSLGRKPLREVRHREIGEGPLPDRGRRGA